MHSVATLPPCVPPATRAAVAACPARVSTGQGWLIRLFDALGNWHDRALDRRHLAGLDERMLHDIGVDRATAIEEIRKPFWRR